MTEVSSELAESVCLCDVYPHHAGETLAGADGTGVYAAVLDEYNTGMRMGAGRVVADREAGWKHGR